MQTDNKIAFAEEYSLALDVTVAQDVAGPYEHCSSTFLRGNSAIASASCEGTSASQIIKISANEGYYTFLQFCEIQMYGSSESGRDHNPYW
jgi:hypothetical protein